MSSSGAGRASRREADERGDEILGAALGEQRARDLAIVVGRLVGERADLVDEHAS